LAPEIISQNRPKDHIFLSLSFLGEKKMKK
jgi:hypothetical protein